VASVGIAFGAISSSGMMEVARKGIFNPGEFVFEEIMFIFMSKNLTDLRKPRPHYSFNLYHNITIFVNYVNLYQRFSPRFIGCLGVPPYHRIISSSIFLLVSLIIRFSNSTLCNAICNNILRGFLRNCLFSNDPRF